MTVEELTRSQESAVRRWKGGHHAFHVLLVAMNTRLARRLSCSTPARTTPPRRWDELSGLYRAATALMRYVLGLPCRGLRGVAPAVDDAAVRQPGLLRPGQPGPRDHAGPDGPAAVAVARDEEASPRVKAAGARLTLAQKDNRASHMLVCRRFVPDGQSLLREFFRQRREEGDPRWSRWWRCGTSGRSWPTGPRSSCRRWTTCWRTTCTATRAGAGTPASSPAPSTRAGCWCSTRGGPRSCSPTWSAPRSRCWPTSSRAAAPAPRCHVRGAGGRRGAGARRPWLTRCPPSGGSRW